jgi:hypothetical protein
LKKFDQNFSWGFVKKKIFFWKNVLTKIGKCEKVLHVLSGTIKTLFQAQKSSKNIDENRL